VEYIYKRAEVLGLEPVIVHYARFAEHPELHASLANLLRGELNLWPRAEHYELHGMRAIAIGAYLPEWEPNRIRSNRLWRKTLNMFDRFILVTGSAHTGLPLAQHQKPFTAWVSSTVENDRKERLTHERGFNAALERLGLPSIKNAEHHVLDAATRILAVSRDAKDQMDLIAQKNSEVWPFPIDTGKFRPGRRDRNLSRFLFVGRANDPRKRIALFLDACEALQSLHPEFDFVASIVSRELPPTAFGRPYIEHQHDLTDQEIVALYQSATVLILTSEQEGLGIAAMEAMACGVPVISTRCGGPETFIVDNITGFFVSDDPKEIADRMFTIANDEAIWNRLSEASSQRIEAEFSERVWNEKFDRMLATTP